MAQNIEWKARVTDDPVLQQRADQLLDSWTEVILLHVDTYFSPTSGRLKLREITNQTGSTSAELIGYHRGNDVSARSSVYHRVAIDDPASLIAMLQANLGIETVVKKRRRALLQDNIRVHLDTVEGLGTFAEIEVIVDDARPPEFCTKQLDDVRTAFGLLPPLVEPVGQSYLELSLSNLSNG